MLPVQADPAAAVRRAAALLADLPAMWAAAEPAERNTLARTAFASVEFEDERIAAVIPQPDLVPYFVALNSQTPGDKPGARKGSADGDGSDGIRTRDLSLDRAAC